MKDNDPQLQNFREEARIVEQFDSYCDEFFEMMIESQEMWNAHLGQKAAAKQRMGLTGLGLDQFIVHQITQRQNTSSRKA